jgi:FADH2 O2-dependent halogenase
MTTPLNTNSHYDLAIVGSGFSGSLLAMIARSIGLSVILLERGKHPRFAIGESTSPLANLLIEQLAERYNLPRLLPLTSFGPWLRAYPEVHYGLKRGFTFFKHESGRPYHSVPDRSNQLMVAASPIDEVADTHWFRADVDEFFMKEAVSQGADYLDETNVTLLQGPDENGATLSLQRGNDSRTVHARLLIDATGPRGFLSRALNIPEASFQNYPPTQTLFSHFTGVRRCDQMPDFSPLPSPGEHPPYPMDDAALHHVFDGGWMWVLRFNNGVTSAGIACTDEYAHGLNLAEREPAWERLMARFPSIAEQFEEAEPVQPFIYSPRLTYRSTAAAGTGWAMLPSAAAFVDPLFSTGIPLTLLGIERLSKILEESWGSNELNTRLKELGELTLNEADWTAKFIGACYAAMRDFPRFADFSMFYFAAASYSEMARRLQEAPSVRPYLAADQPEFAQGLEWCAEILTNHKEPLGSTFAGEVAERINSLNVAGLADPDKRNWYGVDLEDLVINAEKLGFTPAEMSRIIETAPWAQCSNA